MAKKRQKYAFVDCLRLNCLKNFILLSIYWGANEAEKVTDSKVRAIKGNKFDKINKNDALFEYERPFYERISWKQWNKWKFKGFFFKYVLPERDKSYFPGLEIRRESLKKRWRDRPKGSWWILGLLRGSWRLLRGSWGLLRGSRGTGTLQ